MSEKHVKILKAAKRRIDNYLEDLVCCAIKTVVEQTMGIPYKPGPAEPHHYEEHMEVYELLNLIEMSIAPCVTVERWLLEEHDIRLEGDERRAYRMAWIDSMIEYWKDKP